MDGRLGRLQEFDDLSRNFPIRAVIRERAPLRSYTWSCQNYLDQGREGACVGFAFSHEASARPVKVQNVTDAMAVEIYKRAKQLDGYLGENYEGTSVIAGAKACVERGWYREYRWGFGLEDVLLALGYKGPVVLGLNWYEGMFSPDSNGFIHAKGDLMGGHAILANGVSLKNKTVRLHNSWGRGFGMNGECFISFDDLDRLLHEQGEACIPLGRRL